MDKKSFLKAISDKNIVIKEGVCLKELTSFKIGGNAEFFAEVKTAEEVAFCICKAKEYNQPLFVLGKGSNLLVSDKGIKGLVLDMSGLDSVRFKGETVICGAGLHLQKLCTLASNKELSGLEFAFGIPGSVGGAVYMNAGAYGGEIADCISWAKCIDKSGNTVTLNKEQMELGYRTSIFKKEALIITEVSFLLHKGKKDEINAKMADFMGRRRDKQPLEFPSAGSTFKRPEGHFAGALIEKNGLKGKSVGGAKVSEKHAGFVINFQNAKCEDVKALIKEIQEIVKKNDGVNLETEVIFVGEE